MIAVDTNILVYAHREDSPWHVPADGRLTELAESGQPWGIPWPCIHEFLAITTHPRIYKPPTPLQDALTQVENWLASPSLVVLGERTGYWEVLKRTAVAGQISGPRFHDARIAAICSNNGVQVLWSADRDFSRFTDLRTQNPLIP